MVSKPFEADFGGNMLKYNSEGLRHLGPKKLEIYITRIDLAISEEKSKHQFQLIVLTFNMNLIRW